MPEAIERNLPAIPHREDLREILGFEHMDRKELEERFAPHFDSAALYLDSVSVSGNFNFATGSYTIPSGEAMPVNLSGHHPGGEIIFRGVDQIEAMQQLILAFFIKQYPNLLGFRAEGIKDLKFKSAFKPGDEAEIKVKILEVEKLRGGLINVTAQCSIGKKGWEEAQKKNKSIKPTIATISGVGYLGK
ncbi:MAG: hypothetical protein PHO48_01090 [Candidatus Gracilibacteria bacterium]|nr:hypothetical protein [Candidatus Gracilibacteria bacterium]MDD5179342.1 hypothetical protein [Candidatus Gracilibacteria bacterium]